MFPSLPPILSTLRGGLAALLILAGAAGVLAGTLAPWATFKLFHNVEINLPGLVFLWGGLCLSVASLVFLGMRRSPLLCLLGAFAILFSLGRARTEIPEGIRRQIVGAQGALVPVNRLLDQFHINSADGTWPIEVATFQDREANLIGDGVTWAKDGALVLLLGSVLGLPGDPALVWIYARTARARCRACGARWMLSRGAKHCPVCGASTLPAHVRECPHCQTIARRGDRHCVACGTALPAIAERPGRWPARPAERD